MTPDDLLHRFMHHPPTAEKVGQHESVRGSLLQLADWFRRLLPEGREKSTAMTKLEEAMFWANAAIARAVDPALEDPAAPAASEPVTAPLETPAEPAPAPDPVTPVIPAQAAPADDPAPAADPAAAPEHPENVQEVTPDGGQ